MRRLGVVRWRATTASLLSTSATSRPASSTRVTSAGGAGGGGSHTTTTTSSSGSGNSRAAGASHRSDDGSGVVREHQLGGSFVPLESKEAKEIFTFELKMHRFVNVVGFSALGLVLAAMLVFAAPDASRRLATMPDPYDVSDKELLNLRREEREKVLARRREIAAQRKADFIREHGEKAWEQQQKQHSQSQSQSPHSGPQQSPSQASSGAKSMMIPGGMDTISAERQREIVAAKARSNTRTSLDDEW